MPLEAAADTRRYPAALLRGLRTSSAPGVPLYTREGLGAPGTSKTAGVSRVGVVGGPTVAAGGASTTAKCGMSTATSAGLSATTGGWLPTVGVGLPSTAEASQPCPPSVLSVVVRGGVGTASATLARERERRTTNGPALTTGASKPRPWLLADLPLGGALLPHTRAADRDRTTAASQPGPRLIRARASSAEAP